MIIGELFERLGLKTDAASFAKGALAAKGVEVALAKIGEAARWVTDQLKESTFGVFDEADALAKLSARVGVSAQALQELQYAGSLADVSSEDLATSLKFLNKNMLDAADGSIELKKVFKTLGVDVVDPLTKKLRPTEEVFTELAAKFDSMPESAAKSAYAMKVLGKSGGTLLTMFGGLTEARQEFRDLHGDFSDDFLKNAQDFNDNISRLKTVWSGIQFQVADALLPVVQSLVGDTLEWVKANKDLIKVKVREWVEDAVATVRYWVAAIQDWIKEQGGLPAVIDKASTALKYFATFLVTAEVLGFVKALFQVPVALKAIKVAIAANPIGLLLVLLATAVTLWIENWDDMRDFFIMVWDGISSFLRATVDAMGEILSGFGKALYYIFVYPFVAAWDWIKNIWDEGVDWIEKKIRRLGEIISDAGEILNPFNTEGNTSGVRGATEGGSALADAAFLANRQVSDIVAPRVNAGTGARSVSVTSSPNITIVTDPSQSNEQIGRIAAQKIAEHNQGMLREAAGGID